MRMMTFGFHFWTGPLGNDLIIVSARALTIEQAFAQALEKFKALDGSIPHQVIWHGVSGSWDLAKYVNKNDGLFQRSKLNRYDGRFDLDKSNEVTGMRKALQ